MKKTRKNENKGITLIALIVTIIVLIILAGISINLILGDNGVIQRAKDSKEQTLIAQYKEQIDLIRADVGVRNEGIITLEKLNTAFNENGQSNWVNNTEATDSLIKLTTNDGYVFFVTPTTTEYKGKGDVIIPETILAETVQFTPTDTTWKAKDGSDIKTIEQALDYLYGD